MLVFHKFAYEIDDSIDFKLMGTQAPKVNFLYAILCTFKFCYPFFFQVFHSKDMKVW